MDDQKQFVVISGRSGSGKSIALHALEDSGFTCVDNLPVGLLPALIAQVAQAPSEAASKFAVGIDARNLGGNLSRFPDILASAQNPAIRFNVLYLDASNAELIKRFSETRRKHPLTSKTMGLQEAIIEESEILEPVARLADYTIDTTRLTLHELRSAIKKRLVGSQTPGLALMFESFGFKFGMPVDADFVFDVRCLPNPYWQPELRAETGRDQGVQKFLASQPQVEAMFTDIAQFVEKWLPSYEANNRSYLTVAIGCTGGMHRSVYLTEKLAEHFKQKVDNVQSFHRQLGIGASEVHGASHN